MLFRFAESVINIAHVPKECLYCLRLSIAMSSAATATPKTSAANVANPSRYSDRMIRYALAGFFRGAAVAIG
jgi:hypothetical protein